MKIARAYFELNGEYIPRNRYKFDVQREAEVLPPPPCSKDILSALYTQLSDLFFITEKGGLLVVSEKIVTLSCEEAIAYILPP